MTMRIWQGNQGAIDELKSIEHNTGTWPMVSVIDLPRNHYAGSSLMNCAWPGMYPLYYVTLACEVLCPKCANESEQRIKTKYTQTDAFRASDIIVSVSINWEDTELYCEECGEAIECACGGD